MHELINRAAAELEAAAVPDPDHDAWQLACWAAGLDSAGLALELERLGADREFQERFAAGIERRAKREPLQWIEGRAAFLDFFVEVGNGVLIPRPETETTALVAIEVAREISDACELETLRILDAGTGSGVLAIALARTFGHAEVHATDRSTSAMVWAARNKKRLAPQVALHEAWFLGVNGSFDMIVSNPPYVSENAWSTLEPEVRDHDPKASLVPGGGSGLGDLEMLVSEAREHLRPHGVLVVEIGHDQGDAVVELAAALGFAHVELRRDLAGRDRVMVARIERCGLQASQT